MGQGTAYKMGKGLVAWKSANALNLTLVVTEDCNLRCRYCYMVHKSNLKRMNLDMAKKAIDYVLDNDDLQQEAIILEFIGGEPLIEMDLIDQITDYFKLETYRRNHRWFSMHRFCEYLENVMIKEIMGLFGRNLQHQFLFNQTSAFAQDAKRPPVGRRRVIFLFGKGGIEFEKRLCNHSCSCNDYPGCPSSLP